MRPSMSSRVGSGITFGQAVKPSGTGNVSWYRNTSDWRYEICMLHAASRALRPSSRQTSPFVIITLLLTDRPAGVASPIADLYASTCSFMSWIAATLNPSTPRPWRPAFSYVGGFNVAAIHDMKEHVDAYKSAIGE